MSTIIGYFCTNSELTSDAIQQLEPDFTEPESHSAMGFAWVQDGRLPESSRQNPDRICPLSL